MDLSNYIQVLIHKLLPPASQSCACVLSSLCYFCPSSKISKILSLKNPIKCYDCFKSNLSFSDSIRDNSTVRYYSWFTSVLAHAMHERYIEKNGVTVDWLTLNLSQKLNKYKSGVLTTTTTNPLEICWRSPAPVALGQVTRSSVSPHFESWRSHYFNLIFWCGVHDNFWYSGDTEYVCVCVRECAQREMINVWNIRRGTKRIREEKGEGGEELRRQTEKWRKKRKRGDKKKKGNEKDGEEQ